MAFDVQKTNIEISAVDKTKVAFDSIKGSITNLTGQFGALTGLLGTGAFLAFTKNVIDQADSMNDLSQRTGIAVDRLGAWRLATEQSGTSMEALTSALGRGSKYLVQHGEDLKKIGINAKTSEELILQLSGVISNMSSDDPRRTALAMQVLGKGAGELIPLLNGGEEALRKQLEAGEKWNKMTPEMAKNADIFNDKLAEFKFRTSNIGISIVKDMLPPMTRIIEIIERATEKTSTFTEKLKAMGLFMGPSFAIPALREAFTDTPEQKGIAQSGKIRKAIPKVFDDKSLNDFLKSDSSSAPKKDAIAERIKSLGVENTLLAQGVSIEDARTIARLKADGATDQQIVKMLNLTNAQNQYETAEKAAEKTKQDLIKATEDHAEAMQKLLQTADDAVINAQAQYAESERNLQVMQMGESAVIRMESARLLEAAASAEQGLAYARLNGLSQENIDFTETQILRLKQLAEARLKVAGGIDATTAFEKEKDRIKELADEQKKAEQDVARNREQYAREFSQALTNGLFDSFKKGESFGKAMFRNLTSLAKTVFVREIEGLLSGGGGGILGSVLGIGTKGIPGASGGGFGGGGSILGGLGDLFQKGNSSLIGSIESLGTFLSTGTGGLGDLLGGALGQYAGQISNVLPFAGAAFSLLTGNVKGAIGSALGAALSFTPLGPIGGIVGSLIGGGLFGSKKPRAKIYSSVGISSFQDGELTSSSTPAYASGKRFVELGAGKNLLELNKNFATSINTILKEFGISNKIDTWAFVGQRKKEARGQFSASLNGQSAFWYDNPIQGNAQQAFEQMVDDVMSKGVKAVLEQSTLPDSIKKFFTELESKEEVNDAINTIVGLKRSLVDLPTIFNSIRDALDTTTYKVSIADLKARFEAVGTYTSLFYSAEENFATFTRQLTTQFTALNTALPTTRDGFRSLVDGLMNDFSESGRTQFNGLVALAPAADSYYKQLLAQKELLEENARSLLTINSFASLAEYRAAKGIANNYGANVALDFTANSRIGNIATNENGVASASGVENLTALLAELRDLAKQQLAQNADGTSLLQRFDRVGIPTRA